MEAQTGSTSFQFRTPGTARTKTDAHVAYGVRFGCSLYGWKDNFKKLPMEPVSGPNSSGVDGESVPVLHHYFGPMGRVSSWSPLGTYPRVWTRP
jgi:hypothetical protein